MWPLLFISFLNLHKHCHFVICMHSFGKIASMIICFSLCNNLIAPQFCNNLNYAIGLNIYWHVNPLIKQPLFKSDLKYVYTHCVQLHTVLTLRLNNSSNYKIC